MKRRSIFSVLTESDSYLRLRVLVYVVLAEIVDSADWPGLGPVGVIPARRIPPIAARVTALEEPRSSADLQQTNNSP